MKRIAAFLACLLMLPAMAQALSSQTVIEPAWPVPDYVAAGGGLGRSGLP